MKMIYCYLYLIWFAMCALSTGKFQKKCYNYNPLVINGTQPASELRCPEDCTCTYCAFETPTLLKYRHNVDCSHLQLITVPLTDSVPTDVVYYFLQNNDIVTMENNSFSASYDLEYLHLDYNRLQYTTIGIEVFHGLKKLRYLSMNNNHYLNTLRTFWFSELVSLELLHLQFCGINTIENDVFEHCKHLIKVDLSGNSIVTFSTDVFQNLPSLMYIFMHHNILSELPNKAFTHSENLQAISLHDNSLSTISENVGLQNLTQLQFLNVSYNKFVCDCNLVWFRNWIGKTNVTLDDIGRTKCVRQHSKVYKKIMDFNPDKLQCNKLVYILKIVIPSVSAAVGILVIGSLLYYFRYDVRYWNQRRRLRKQYQRLVKEGPVPINGQNIRYDAFVAYNSKDQQWVLKVLQPSLETQRNFKLCIDYRDFVAGERVVDNIADAVKYSRKVLLIVSKNFVKSEWCYFELEMARMRMFDNHEDILVVVLLEKVSSKDMPILLHKILTKKTYIEWEEQPEKQALFWAKLEGALLSPNCPKYRLLDSTKLKQNTVLNN